MARHTTDAALTALLEYMVRPPAAGAAAEGRDDVPGGRRDRDFAEIMDRSSLGTSGARDLMERTDRRHAGLVRDLVAVRALRNEIVHGARSAAEIGPVLTEILLSRLSDRRRQVLELELLHGLSTADISQVLGISTASVREDARRAKRQLADLLHPDLVKAAARGMKAGGHEAAATLFVMATERALLDELGRGE
ncbi:RNA polymerase sigma factor [Streptomyces sp. NRRL F-5123]|uniref:RNA polymerase sigma factor n=1 Tax=Streptomyces sp. NRRL F-5123 TaxID=1463856 RepID=UPI0004E19A36|nr:sigma factor-like helix-turn-helix DNA-binding protein [Streptomyces sp. NRRL F-5123]